MNDSLGDRMKKNYEVRTQTHLPRRTYTCIRLDGRSFHSYTRGCERPFDTGLMEDMNETARALVKEVSGCRLAYVQSDEISLVLTDFEEPSTQAWFDGNVQKMVSISASIATAEFNRRRLMRLFGKVNLMEYITLGPVAHFDSRVFIIPDRTEVENYLIWRQKDATRNSISMAAQAQYSHNQLHGKSAEAMQEMLFQKGINWNDYPAGFKRGRCAVRVPKIMDVNYTNKHTGDVCTEEGVERTVIEVVDPPIFTQEREWLAQYVPVMS